MTRTMQEKFRQRPVPPDAGYDPSGLEGADGRPVGDATRDVPDGGGSRSRVHHPQSAAAPPLVTPDTEWRGLGDATEDDWRALLPIDSPILRELSEVMRQASPYDKLALAQSIRESSGGTEGRGVVRRNPLGLMDLSGSTLMSFGTWAAAFAEFRRRLQSDTYKGGVYHHPRARTLRGYTQLYVGGPGCWDGNCANGETPDSVEWYLGEMVADLNNMDGVSPPPPAPDPIVFGRVPKPAIADRWITDAQNSAWNNIGPRTVRGLVYHRMLGTLDGTDGYFRNGAPGLTDFGVDHSDGRIYRWNDETGAAHPGCSPNRAPHASGPWEGQPGGRAFVAKYGVSAINRDLASVEISGNYDTHIRLPGHDAIVDVSAWLADRAKVPWTTYPQNPHTGLTFVYKHNDFQGHKPCPGVEIENDLAQIVADTKSVLRYHQGGEAPPPPAPEFPGLTIPVSVFRQCWPPSVPPDPKGPFTQFVLREFFAKGLYCQVFWRAADGTDVYFGTSQGMFRFRAGQIEEVQDA